MSRELPPTCAYCDRGIAMHVKGDPRCFYHLFLDPWRPPRAIRCLVRARIRRAAEEAHRVLL